MNKTCCKTANIIFLLTIFCVTSILIFSCTSASAGATANYKEPYVEYSISGAEDKDPLLEFKNNTYSDSSKLKNVTIGIILTNNTMKAMDLVKKTYDGLSRGILGMFKNYSAMEDLDTSFLTDALFAKLRQKFKDIVILNGEDDRQSESVDAIMYLDIKISIGMNSGNQTTVAIQGIIVERNKHFIGQVKGNGVGIVPYPALSLDFKTASSQAVENFNTNLEGAASLAMRLKDLAAASVSQVQETVVPPTLEKVGGYRLALVIGNSNYSSAPLKNTIADAKIIATSLNHIGVDTIYVENIKTSKEFVSVLKDFNKKAKDANVILFYYAGHGVQIQGRNYLIPVEAQLDVESDVDYECLDLERVLALLSDGNKAVHVAIIDACRDNPFLSSSRSLSTRGLSVVSKATSETLIAYSTSPGTVALDGEGKNGPYALAFATVLAEKNLQIEEIFKKVRATVNKETNGKQIPWESSSIEKELILNP
jgi:hypothetical protein